MVEEVEETMMRNDHEIEREELRQALPHLQLEISYLTLVSINARMCKDIDWRRCKRMKRS